MPDAPSDTSSGTQGVATAETGKLRVLAVYGWREFWSMGEGKGAPSFFLSITSFPRRGHEMHVLMPGLPGTPAEEDYHGVTLHRFHTSVDFMPEAGSSRLLQHLKRLVTYVYWFIRAVPAGRALAEKVDPDVVVGMGELGAPVARRLARGRGVPNVTRLFGVGLTEIVGNRLKLWLRYRETRALTTPADYIILCDDGSRGDAIAKDLGVDTDRLLYWPNGVDKTLYESGARERNGRERDIHSALGIPDANHIVLTVSRLHFEKHIERMIHAVPGVINDRDDVTFVIVGSGEDRETLESLAASLGVADHVVFAGSFERRDLPGFYRAADLFVGVSDRTNVSNSLHEAMMSRLPVVVLNTGGTGDVVQDGANGILLERDDLPRLHEVILSLLADEERRRAIGERARASANSRLKTLEERQDMEAGVAERAVAEARAKERAAAEGHWTND